MRTTYIEVAAMVRYWGDATVNGVEDTCGDMIPCRNGDLWTPIIRLDGVLFRWPRGTEADVHYKVCDGGKYWLLSSNHRRSAKWKGNYVPDSFLCHGADGYGDYIIMRIDGAGRILDWRTPNIDQAEWEPICEPSTDSEVTP